MENLEKTDLGLTGLDQIPLDRFVRQRIVVLDMKAYLSVVTMALF